MNQQTSDQGWQQLQAHIEGFFCQTLRNDVQRIEYKPLFIVQLLEMPFERANWAPYVQVDGKLVTGQNPASSGPAAEELLKLIRSV